MAEMQKNVPHAGGLASGVENPAKPQFFEFPTGDEGVIRVPSPYLSPAVPPPTVPNRPEAFGQDDGNSGKTNRTGTPHVSSGELRSPSVSGFPVSELTERPARRTD